MLHPASHSGRPARRAVVHREVLLPPYSEVHGHGEGLKVFCFHTLIIRDHCAALRPACAETSSASNMEEEDRESRSARVLTTVVSWTIAAMNSRGISKIDPNIVVDKQTLRRVGKVVCVYSTRPLVQGAAALLELFARLILLVLFLALSCSPRHRTAVVEKVRTSLETHVNTVRG